MNANLINEFAKYGIFAGLFVALLLYVLKENAKREADYRDIIASLSSTLNEHIKVIVSDVCDIKNKIFK